MTLTPEGIAEYITRQKEQITSTLTQEFSKELQTLREQIESSKKALVDSTSITAKVVADLEELKDQAKKAEAQDLAEVKPLKNVDRKDVDKPDKYGGNTDLWLKWSRGFKKFLKRQDPRWIYLLEAIEKLRGKPVTKAHEDGWKLDLGVYPGTMNKIPGLGEFLEDFKDQLNEYLETYTQGAAKSLVSACGDTKALDAWRQLADKGHSLREQHVQTLRRKAYFPRAVSQIKDLETQINLWEADVDLFEAATDEKFPDANRRMNLVDMCPDSLRKTLKERDHRLDTYEGIKTEIADWIADLDRAKGGRVAALDGPEPPDPIPGFEVPLNFDPDTMTDQELRALVKSKFIKKPKGAGKGDQNNQGGKKTEADNSNKVCYDCGEPGHIGADCPQRKARVAAGGPERNPNAKSKGRGKDPWHPTKGMWKSWFPGPTQTAWASWYPDKGAGKGYANFTGKGHTLKAMNPAEHAWQDSWMSAPGAMLASLTVKSPTVEHENMFKELADTDDGEEMPEIDQSAEPVPDMPDLGSVPVRPRRSPRGKSEMEARMMRAEERQKQLLTVTQESKDITEDNPPDLVPSDDEAEAKKPVRVVHSLYSGGQRRLRKESKSGWCPLADEPAMAKLRKECSPNGCGCSAQRPRKSLGLTQAFDRGKNPTEEEFPDLGWSVVNAGTKKQKAKQAMAKRKDVLAPLTEKRPQSLRPLSGSPAEWEYMEAILDSGATVTVIPPSVGKDYEIVRGEAAEAGVKYEVANGEEIPNLGEKLMAVVTAEGSMRGLRAQVADVNKPLQAVRSLVRAGHMVVFGAGENGDQNYVLNKFTGDCSMVKDDGLNYLMGMYIVTRSEAGFARPVATPQRVP